jgi:hypothetical protein
LESGVGTSDGLVGGNREMILEIVVLSWFAILFLIGVGQWIADNSDADLMLGAIVALGIPTLIAFVSLIWRIVS